MKAFFESLTGLFGGKGYRTYVAAGIALLVAVNHVIPLLDASTMQAVLALAAALGFYAADESPHDTPASS